MDTKRFNDKSNIEYFKTQLAYKLSKIPEYDVIITGDDNALTFALENHHELLNNTPVVFLGVNNVTKALQQNQNPLVTGVIEAVSIRETIELMTKLHPSVKKVVALVDSTPSGQGDLANFYKLAGAFRPTLFEDISLAKITFEHMTEQLRTLGEESVVLLLSAYRDKDNNSMLFNECLDLITKHLSRPLYHLWYHGMGDGLGMTAV